MSEATISPLVSPGTARAEVAASVRAHIAARNTNDSRVARAIGMTQAYLSRRTNEDVAFDSDDLGRIAEHFGISLAELVQMPKLGTTGGGNQFIGTAPLHHGWASTELDEKITVCTFASDHLAPVTPIRREVA